jgi:hypothetical protein
MERAQFVSIRWHLKAKPGTLGESHTIAREIQFAPKPLIDLSSRLHWLLESGEKMAFR